MSVEDVIGKLKSKDKNMKVSNAVGFDPERQEVPSISLNRALGGGFGYGRQVLIWGTKAAGKTAFCLQTIAKAQAAGKVCAFVDAEKTYSSTWAEKLGVDNESLVLVRYNTIPDAANSICSMMEAGVDLIVLDSINALLPKSQLTDSGQLKDMGENNQIGQFSKDLSDAMSRMNACNDNTLLILISQGRQNLGSYGAPMKASGGNAVEYYSSQIVKLWSSKAESQAIKAKTYIGNKIVQDTVGREVTWTIEANKLGPMWVSGAYPFIFKGDEVGIDNIAEIAQLAIELEILEKAGAWYSYGEKKFHGSDAVIEWLHEDELAFSELKKLVLDG